MGASNLAILIVSTCFFHLWNLLSYGPAIILWKVVTWRLSCKGPIITNNHKFHTFCLFFKYIISWEIRALKQYPLITKEAWIVLEAILKARASCLTGVSRQLETIKALGLRPLAFICFSVTGYPGQTRRTSFWSIILNIHNFSKPESGKGTVGNRTGRRTGIGCRITIGNDLSRTDRCRHISWLNLILI